MSRHDGITVYKCGDGKYYPRKRDRVGDEPYVTLDHHQNWKQYILEHAEPDSEGRISKKSAAAAYNDMNNLVLMSNVQNAAKNGPHGMID